MCHINVVVCLYTLGDLWSTYKAIKIIDCTVTFLFFIIISYHHNPINAHVKLIVFITIYNKGEHVQNTHLICKQFCCDTFNQISIQNN